MTFTYIHSDNARESINLELPYEKSDGFKRIKSTNKLSFIKEFFPAYKQSQSLVLFDQNHKQLTEFYEKNDINTLVQKTKIEKDTRLLFFTSGSSGFPVGAFKTVQNLKEEVSVLKELVLQKSIKKVVVTVPFVHIYGVLAGLLLPLALGDVELVVKEDFLPYELLGELEEGETLVVTTPVFIKALGKLSEKLDLSSNLFISSTGPLALEDIESFDSLYNASLMQLFGSTETGGIAYKMGKNTKWKPLQNVEVKSQDERLSVRSPYISKFILDGTIKELGTPFVTEDIVKINKDGFSLLGRSNKLIKIAGKRISALTIESLLEKIDGVERAVVTLVYKKELLRSEQILITLQATKEFKKSFLKEKISECYGVLTIPFKVVYVEEIRLSSMGKKVLF